MRQAYVMAGLWVILLKSSMLLRSIHGMKLSPESDYTSIKSNAAWENVH